MNMSPMQMRDEILSVLKSVVDEAKHLSDKERIEFYIEYVAGFNYDKGMRERRLDLNHPENTESAEQNIKDLYQLITEKSGVCQQFGQAYALLCHIDGRIKGYYSTGYLKVPHRKTKVGHVVNTVVMDNEALIVDISSMIHCRDKDYKQNPDAFKLVSLKQYIKNLKNDRGTKHTICNFKLYF